MKTDYQSRVKVIGPQGRVQVIPSLADRLTSTKEMPLKRVCAYCRVSTAQEEQQSSYELQVAYYTDFIQQNKLWEFSGIYADEGISGTSIKHRTDFLRMVQDCQDGIVDLIITKSISRFARNTLDCLNYVRMLKALPSPVGIYFEKENIDTLDVKSELLLTLLSSLAQDESRSISENVRWSIQKRYQQGIVQFDTNSFLGYDRDADGNLIIDEEQAETVRRIYRECLEGYGTSLIAKRLTADGVKTGKGNTVWVANSVNRILHNEKYCGDIIMQKRVTLDYLTHKRTPNSGQLPQYFIADHHPAIISKSDWNAVQLEQNRRTKMRNVDETDRPQRHSNRTVFSNILYCGTCGEPFIRRTLTSTHKNEPYLFPAWKCRVADGRVKGKVCHTRSYREEVMEHSFMAMLLEMKLGQVELIREAEKAIAQDDLDAWEKERLSYLETEMESLKERLCQVAVSSQKSAARDVYDDLSIDLTREMEVVQSEMGQLNEKKQEALVKRRCLKWLIEELNNLHDFNAARESVDFRADIFRNIVLRGDADNDGSIMYELKIGVTRKTKGHYSDIRKLWSRENAKI